jgi:hypothetical protein
VSAGFGHLVACGLVSRRFEIFTPAFGALGLVFGLWYALGALQAVPYAF